MKASQKRILVLLGAAALAIAAWMIPRKDRADAMAVAIGVWPGTETLVMARERGMFPAERIRLVEMTWDSAGVRAMTNKAVDGAVLSLDEVLRLREGGHDLRVVLVFDQSLTGDAILSRTSTLSDLRGKRIGVDVRAAGVYLLTAALAKSGLTLNDVTLVPMSPPDMAESFEMGAVDAVVCLAPWLPDIQSKGATSVFKSEEAPVPITRVLVMRGDALHAYDREIRLLIRAHFSLLDDLRSLSASPGRDAVLRREQVDAKQFIQSLKGLRLIGLDENRSLLGGQSPGIEAMARKVEAVMLGAEQLSGPSNDNPWFDASFFPAP